MYRSVRLLPLALLASLLTPIPPRLAVDLLQAKSQKLSGQIRGRILFRGNPIPEPTVIENGTDPDVCGSRQSFEDVLISGENRGIQNVIVSLAGSISPPRPGSSGEVLTVANRNCRFQPHVAVLQTGSTVETVNDDPIFHTTHLYQESFSRNLSLHVGGKASQGLPRPGLVIVKCDIHGWMKAYIRVDPHPFHAVSDAGGRFEIRDVPPGSYTLEIWHESLGEQKLPVTVKAGQAENLVIEYPVSGT